MLVRDNRTSSARDAFVRILRRLKPAVEAYVLASPMLTRFVLERCLKDRFRVVACCC